MEALSIMNLQHGDPRYVAQLLEQAVQLGDPHAAYALGTWFLHGAHGYPKDKNKGAELFEVAADAKLPDALFDLAVCYERGDGVEKNPGKAFLLYLDAAVRGDKQAVFEVSRCYTFGIGVLEDAEVAEVWRVRSKELGTFEDE